MEQVNNQTSGAQRFVTTFYPYALQSEKDCGISAIFTLAQAALESDWGAKTTGDYNYWGIKADSGWKGAFKVVPTHEVVNGQRILINAKFRSYPDPATAFNDHGKFFFDNPRYKTALLVKGSPNAFAIEIAHAGYATDPKYAQTLIDMINSVKKRLPA